MDGTWHVVRVQQFVGFTNVPGLASFHLVTAHHCALLLNRDTFESCALRSMFCAVATLGGLWKSWSCPASSDDFLTLRVSTSPSRMCISTMNAKSGDPFALRFLPLLRGLCKRQGVVLLAGNFYKAAHLDQQCRSSRLETAFHHAPVPWPTGGITSIWGPGAEPDAAQWPDYCGCVRMPHTQNRWHIKRHGSFQLVHESIALSRADHNWHHDLWMHLQFASRDGRRDGRRQRSSHQQPSPTQRRRAWSCAMSWAPPRR